MTTPSSNTRSRKRTEAPGTGRNEEWEAIGRKCRRVSEEIRRERPRTKFVELADIPLNVSTHPTHSCERLFRCLVEKTKKNGRPPESEKKAQRGRSKEEGRVCKVPSKRPTSDFEPSGGGIVRRMSMET